MIYTCSWTKNVYQTHNKIIFYLHLKYRLKLRTLWLVKNNVLSVRMVFKKDGSRKILVKIHGCRSLVFERFCASCSLDFFTKPFWSLDLKSKKVSGSQRKTLVSPSRKVSNLPFTLVHGQIPEFEILDRWLLV